MNTDPVEKIIALLKQRKGFDDWWHDIHPLEKDAMIEEFAAIIDEHIEFNYR